MISLPDSAVTAALALILGLILGAGSYHLLSSSPPERLLTSFEQEGMAVLERDRPISEEDTSGQEEPDLEIRYRTVRDTLRDTLRVPVPSSMSDDPVISDRTPLDLTSDRATWTYWDPKDRRFEQRIFQVPQDNFSVSAYGLLQATSPIPNLDLGVGSFRVGVGLEAEYKRLGVEAETTIGTRIQPQGRVRLIVGL